MINNPRLARWYGIDPTGVDDSSVGINAALADSAGVVILEPGTYRLASTIELLQDNRQLLSGYGAELVPDDGIVAATFTTTSNNYTGVTSTLEGVTIQGNETDTTGVLFQTTVGAQVRDVELLGHDIAVDFYNDDTVLWNEHNRLQNVKIDGATVGVRFRRHASGANSFAGNTLDDVYIDNCDTGVLVNQDCNLYRSKFRGVNVWLRAGQTGFDIDGLMQHVVFDVSLEAFSATGTVGISFGANAEWAHRMHARLDWKGTFGTRVSNLSVADFVWQGGPGRIMSDNDIMFQIEADGLRFFNNGALVPRQTVTGSRGSGAALTSLLTALHAYQLIDDTSTA